MNSSLLFARRPQFAAKPAPHVLTLTPFFPSKQNPASGCFVAEPLRYLEQSGVKSTVLAGHSIYQAKATETSEFRAKHVSFFSLPGGMGLSSAGLFLYQRLIEKVRAIDQVTPIDLIHAHSALPCGHAAWLLSKRLKVPFAVTVHGLDASSRRQVGGVLGWTCAQLSRRIYATAHCVLCVSEKVRNAVTALAPGANTELVYNGVDVEKFSPVGPCNSEPVLLAVGNLIPTKGHDCLLRAFANLRQRFPQLRCRFIGEGPYERVLRDLANELGVSDAVEWLGRRGRNEVALALRDCTIFALPSRYEGLGCVYLEAMAAGKPVIGCRGQGIDEIIVDGINGLLIDPDDAFSLAIKISKLLNDDVFRREIGAKARRTVLNSFTLRHQADRLSRIYGECLG
jgi:glycosyltransferase involved in cell wall biosynthesis